MSRNLADYRREQLLPSSLEGMPHQVRTRRTMQRQGSQALRVEIITGYQYLAVPSGTIVPNHAFVDLTSENPDDIVIATLLRSTFMRYTNGTFVNADTEDHGLADDFWEVWLAYDKRAAPVSQTVPYAPSGTLTSRIATALSAHSLPFNQARVGIRVNRVNSTTKPSTLDQYLIVYQIRVTIGGS